MCNFFFAGSQMLFQVTIFIEEMIKQLTRIGFEEDVDFGDMEIVANRT